MEKDKIDRNKRLKIKIQKEIIYVKDIQFNILGTSKYVVKKFLL